LSITLENAYTSTLDGFGAPGPSVFAVGLALFVMIGIVNVVIRIVLQGRSQTTVEQL
jgi:ABC-type phosphate transport system permease subunit